MSYHPQTVVVSYQGGNDFLVNHKAVKATLTTMHPVDILTDNERAALERWLRQNRFRKVKRSIYTL